MKALFEKLEAELKEVKQYKIQKKDTLQEIAGIRGRIAPDENPNMDENQKTATVK